jgi:putative ABC transport system permease protein
MSATAPLTPNKLRTGDLARVASVGLRTRRVRAALSALGIAIGVAAIVAVLGLSASSRAGLLAEIDRLGTNLLTVSTGQTLFGATAELPRASAGMIGRIGPVTEVADTGSTSANVYRSPLIPSVNTNALQVQAATLDLLPIVGATVARGSYLNAATATEPVCVLGAQAAQLLGIDHVYPGERVWLGGMWFYVTGILTSAILAPEIDSSALVGFPAAEKYLGLDGHPTTIYVRTVTSQTAAVQAVLGATANPESPNEVAVSQPSAALVARADAEGALNGLFLGLGAVSLLVGAVGVANIMIISVLERRSEIGLRRALGATKGNIRTQFLSEAILLAGLGGAVGVSLGVLATAVYANIKQAVSVPRSRSARSPASCPLSAPPASHRQMRCALSKHTSAVTILVVDDDARLRKALRRVLVSHGFEVELAGNGDEALAQIRARTFDAVVLDMMMPGSDGIEVCEQLRADGDQLPVLMLTARDAVRDRVAGLEAGADDYLVKPFANEELIARVRALLRRAGGGSESIVFADLELDLLTRDARRGGREVDLSATEFELLEFFLRHPRQVLARGLIYERVWGYDASLASNSLDVFVGHLRRKLEAGGERRLIQTVRGVGFTLRER